MQTISFENVNYPYAFTEELKQLRTNIEFTGSDKKVIIVTSTFANEGKSTISYELAKSFADLGKNVLLIDADMRLSTLSNKRKGTGAEPKGLSHLLAGQATMEQVLHQVDSSHLYVILSGRFPPNPAELLSNNKMSQLISWARTNFDLIIIDCPPTKVVADASIIAPYSDGALVVVKADSVPKKAAQETIKQLKLVDCPILGVVFNQVKSSKKYYKKRGYYNYYGQDSKQKVKSN